MAGRVPLLLHQLRRAPGAQHQPRHRAAGLPAAPPGRGHRVQDLGLHGQRQPLRRLWTLLGAKLFARDDGTSPLIGFNWSNSVNNETMEITAQFRKALGFEDVVRFEHHITETWKSIVRQPYNRRDELWRWPTTSPTSRPSTRAAIRRSTAPASTLGHPRLLPRQERDHREPAIGTPAAQLPGQAGPVVRGRAKPAPLM
jgi:hypothetical protein